MFSSNAHYLGSTELLSLSDSSGNGMVVVPERGGVLHQLTLGGRALLDSFEDEKDLKENRWYKQTLLFPFPNRLQDGRYSFDGASYQFPINEPDRNNQLHGFLFDQDFHIDNLDLSEDQARLTLTHTYSGDRSYYPFPFHFVVVYEVSRDQFKLEVSITNTGSALLPYGFGWHPYFHFNEVPALQMPPCAKITLSNRAIPTGEEEDFEEFENLSLITDNYDTCFRIKKDAAWDLRVQDSLSSLQLIADKSTSFAQLFNYRSPRLVAIEPMTCNINALNNQDGLLHLEPDATSTHNIQLIHTSNN